MTTSPLDATELHRLEQMMIFEKEAYDKGYQVVVGIDEAGRGPLAGPVMAAACVLPKNFLLPSINDSKQLLPKVRKRLFQQLTTDPAIFYGVGQADHTEIDTINIYQATIQAMWRAICQLPVIPDYLLVDGLSLPQATIPCLKIIRGDTRSQSIAAASIIAKETRDRQMEEWDNQFPYYGFKTHKGYGTPQHLAALDLYGPCPIHRRTFDPLKTKWPMNLEVSHA